MHELLRRWYEGEMTAREYAVESMIYRLTGDSRFLARVPEALDWLESVRLPADQVRDGLAMGVAARRTRVECDRREHRAVRRRRRGAPR